MIKFAVVKSVYKAHEGCLFLVSQYGHCHTMSSVENLLASEIFKENNLL